MAPSDEESKVVLFGKAEAGEDALPFRVELWDRARGNPERVLGRAATIVLAQAIFSAAQVDFKGQRITLSRGSSILMDTQ
ncbi:MAG: hypothetical protein JO303_09690 [Caulobacteraceae bacterium]|nr:hypothetical protein [Caulobacteraceae bacterium]